MLAGVSSIASAIEAGAPMLVSHTSGGEPTSGICVGPHLSRTGQFTGFTCMAWDIVLGQPGVGDALLHDGEADSIIGLSYTDQGQWGQCGSVEPGTCSSGTIAVADDGSLAVMNSSAPLTGDSPHPTPDHGFPNVYLRDVVNQTTNRLTPPLPYPTVLSPRALDASIERTEILIDTQSNYTGNPDTNGFEYDVFVVNWKSREVELISATSTGEQGDGSSCCKGSLSRDGRYVVFASNATNLTDDNSARMGNLFLRDRLLRTTRRLTFPWNGGEFSSQPYILPNMRITSDNRYVLFASTGHEFTPDSNPDVPLSVYEIDLQSDQTRLISRGVNGEPLNASAFGASFSDDGRYMAFETAATNVSDNPGSLPGVFVRDRLTGETVNVSASLGDPPYTLPGHVTLSADGSTVAFSWPEWNATNPNLLNNQQVYKVRLRSDPPPHEAVAVPIASRVALVLLALLLCARAMLAVRGRPVKLAPSGGDLRRARWGRAQAMLAPYGSLVAWVLARRNSRCDSLLGTMRSVVVSSSWQVNCTEPRQ